jgi:predicted phage terminase large subunit-like protein
VALIAATPVIAPGNVLTVGSARRVILTNAAIIFTLKREIPGVISVRPQGGKVVRENAVSPTFEAGNVWLPSPQYAPWISEWQRELMDLPSG